MFHFLCLVSEFLILFSQNKVLVLVRVRTLDFKLDIFIEFNMGSNFHCSLGKE